MYLMVLCEKLLTHFKNDYFHDSLVFLDILKKLVWASSQNSTRALCILSATGVISKVRLEQRATIGGIVTYEGRFEMLSLSGTFIVPENNNQRSRLCGLTVVLAGPDGYALGGNVAGVLTAASPVQVCPPSFCALDQAPPNPVERD
ncbi:putative AT-hook motif nuclear-localized protein [Helianthus annuus]|nr:putative AT-hook motif nuclear-localized protein [Helianthus annuus]